jgi:hypothetical protein
MKTIKFFVSLGILEGYGHDNAQNVLQAQAIVGRAWQEAAAKVSARWLEQDGGEKAGAKIQYASAIISPAHAVYDPKWGCPEGGEIAVLITGEANPAYTDLHRYKDLVKQTLIETGKLLKQSTTQVSFLEGDFEYIDFR